MTASTALSERGYRARKDRAIDPTSGKNTPAEKGPDALSSLGSADGRQPFMPQEYLSNACLLHPFGFAHAMWGGRLLSGACEALFIPRWIIMSWS